MVHAACRGQGCASCNKGNTRGRVWRHDCPLRLREPWTDDVLRLYSMLAQHGVLPDPGGTLDQSAWIMDAFEIVRVTVDQVTRPMKEKKHGRTV